MTSEQRINVQHYLKSKKNRGFRKHIDGEKVKCEECSSEKELEWHHLIPFSEGGKDNQENLAVLCKPCHKKHHSRLNDFRVAGRWGGLVSAYVREQKLGREKFCEYMKYLAKKKAA